MVVEGCGVRGREGAKSHLELYAFPSLLPVPAIQIIEFSALLSDRNLTYPLLYHSHSVSQSSSRPNPPVPVFDIC